MGLDSCHLRIYTAKLYDIPSCILTERDKFNSVMVLFVFFMGLTNVNVQEYGVTLLLYRTPYLVDIVRQKVGRVLTLNSIQAGSVWKDMDILIFNSWHWWTHRGSSQGYDVFQYHPIALVQQTHRKSLRWAYFVFLWCEMQMGLHSRWASIG